MAITLNVGTMSTELQIYVEQEKITIKTFEAFRYHWCNIELRRLASQTNKTTQILNYQNKY